MRFFLSLFLSLIYPAYAYCQTTLDKPSDYNNFIINEQNKLLVKIIEYNTSSIHSDNYEGNNQKRLEIIRQLDASMERLKALPPLDGDAKLRDEALGVFNLYREAYDIEFNDINLLRKDRESSFEAMSAYFLAQDKAEEKLHIAGDRFVKAQKDFAKKHKITLIENTEKNKLEDVAKVNQYSRTVFLEYFRVSSIDAVFLDALNNQKPALMEEKRLQILLAADIALQKINATVPLNNDKAYKDKAIELITYHKQLANKEYLELVTIIKKNTLTQNDITRFNQIVTEINEVSQKLVSEFNKEKREMFKRNLPLN